MTVFWRWRRQPGLFGERGPEGGARQAHQACARPGVHIIFQQARLYCMGQTKTDLPCRDLNSCFLTYNCVYSLHAEFVRCISPQRPRTGT